jgi:nitroreductase
MTTTKQSLDTFLAIVSKREVREYTDEPLPDDVLTRILEAGRATGSAKNRQNWSFLVIRNRDVLDRVAETCSSPANLHKCNVAVAIALHSNLRPEDGGRVMQNMMLAAWADGVGSCPNTPMRREECNRLLGLAPDDHVATILSLGYPAEPVPRSNDADALLRRIKRKPLAEMARYIE